MNRKMISAIGGTAVAIVSAAALAVAWLSIGFKTDVWIDGCPDVVAAHIEAYGPCPMWWERTFLFLLPLILLLVSVLSGLRAYRFLKAKSK